jgi:SsrA-binding protein
MKALINHTRAKFDYEILDTYEAGIELSGSEVKSIRAGKGKLEGAHVIVRGGEAYLVGASISAYQPANVPNGYEPERVRRLLLSHKEIAELEQKSGQRGLTIVPLMMYNKGRLVKLSLAIARGKKKTDKRETIKERETKRTIERTLKNQK